MTYKGQYKKLRKNIQKQIKYYKDKGLLVENELPDIPKRVTKASVRKLEKYKSNFKKLNFIDIETGEKGKLDKLKKERKKDYQQAEKEFWSGGTEESKTGSSSQYNAPPLDGYINFSDSVIAEYRRQISRFPKKVAEIVLTKLDEAIKKSGKDNVAYRLQYNNESLSEYLNNVGLFGDSIQAILEYCDAMFGDLPGMDKESRLQISDIMDSESYSE